jgi:hypothetical protein
MDNKIEINKLKKHIEVLQKSYDNIVEVMSEDVEKETDDNGNTKIALKDEKIKVYAEGQRKSAETLDFLYLSIIEKQKQLDALSGIITTTPIAEKKQESLNNHLA